MEAIPIITESVQYGVIGIAIMQIISQVFIVKAFINMYVKCLDDMKILSTNIGNEIKTLNSTVNSLITKVEMLSIRTKMSKAAMNQSGVLHDAG